MKKTRKSERITRNRREREAAPPDVTVDADGIPHIDLLA